MANEPLDAHLVSVLFNEPKLLKSEQEAQDGNPSLAVSVLFNEPKLLKSANPRTPRLFVGEVSVLFNEPKLLKSMSFSTLVDIVELRFSALQRAEIAEIRECRAQAAPEARFQCSSTSRNC